MGKMKLKKKSDHQQPHLLLFGFTSRQHRRVVSQIINQRCGCEWSCPVLGHHGDNIRFLGRLLCLSSFPLAASRLMNQRKEKKKDTRRPDKRIECLIPCPVHGHTIGKRRVKKWKEERNKLINPKSEAFINYSISLFHFFSFSFSAIFSTIGELISKRLTTRSLINFTVGERGLISCRVVF